MYSITVNNNKVFKADLNLSANNFEGTLNGLLINGDLIKINQHQYHLLYKGKSYSIDIVKLNEADKSLVLKINSQKYTLDIKDKYDELLHNLGFDKLATKKVNDIKAPMPGMVLNILVSECQEIKKGDALIVLEAMKMENILKAPSDGVVKKIIAIKGNAVEKSQLLIQF